MVDIRDGGPWRPTAAEGDRVEDLALNEVIGQALGTASMCWADVGSAGEFDSVRASWVLDGVMAHVNAVIDRVIAGTTRVVGPAPLVAGDAVLLDASRPVGDRTTLRTVDVESMPDGPQAAVDDDGVLLAVSFVDHRKVETLRCYQSGDGGACRRMLVYVAFDDSDPQGWRVWAAVGAAIGELGWREVTFEVPGGWGSRREWRCPDHRGAPLG